MNDRPTSGVTRFLRWAAADGQVWIVIAAILFLILINLPRIGSGGTP
ncbi:MAG TPA: hypothetical protein VEB22_04445 [Phycisphaerales bacterium]|nr:hypothetical protein [Phycisphaerales bacterium]